MIGSGGFMGRLAGLYFLVSAALSAAPASLSSLSGEVTVARSGALIASEKIAEGFGLEPFDTVSTGATGTADLRLAAGVTGTLRLEPNTSVYVEFLPLAPEQVVGVTLVSGSLTVSVTSATGESQLEVWTEAGTVQAAVSGFRLVGTPEGDLLVSGRSGVVVCRFGSRVWYVDPTSALEVLARDQGFSTLPVTPATLGSFETSWVKQRQQAFRDQLARVFRTTAAAYQRQLGYFQRAWDRYQRESDDPRGLLAAAAQLRRAALPLERNLATVVLLRRGFQEGILSPTLEVSRGYPAREFFRQSALDEVPWWARLVEVRGIYRTAAERNGGTFPRVTDGSGITWDSPYFQ